MGVKFTPEQQQIIDLRGCNILVSAAAGSGKTAVLTERIVEIVSDEGHPVDIDRLLVVTFTNAAAAEMRERIGARIGERLLENPESEHLQRQAALLHSAQITTIDSFCLFLMRNHFQEIGLDPAFRVADEQEIKLMQQEVLEELLEDAYEQGEPSFLNCVEVLCHRGKEKVLEEHILNLSRYAASFPWPEEWLGRRAEDYRVSSPEELFSSDAFDYLRHYVSGILGGCAQRLEQAAGISKEIAGPYMYVSMLEEEAQELKELADCADWKALQEKILEFGFGRLPSKKDESVSPEKREWVKKLRDEVKKVIGELRQQFFLSAPESVLRQSGVCADVAGALVSLVIDFDRRMKEKKRERKVIDFSDMEHYALEILLEREDGQVRPSRVAKQYREYFEEILIDEYQDSNLVQEYLLKAVSGEEDGHFNRFLVGDVKQSIYRFRLARPELFLEKYNTYRAEGERRRIDLTRNFRSRETVINTVNAVFSGLMSRETGGIDYDDRAALYPGAVYPENPDMESELLAVEKPDRDSETGDSRVEALAIAGKIRELIQRGKVTDRAAGELRPVRYRDIVILLRTLSVGEDFREVLKEQGIPAYVSSKKGYFDAVEVQDLLNYLRVVDNPLQDIPLYGVLKSRFGGFSEEEIANLRGRCKKGLLYDALKASEDEKAAVFLARLQSYREMVSYLPVRALMIRIVQDYDYLNYVTALPGGGKRRANVEMLFVKASDFEKTSYFGLFHFLRYMEQLEKYEEDYGEADTLEENADVVRIMSIHKSKGLEFPVVFVSSLAKNFNMRDTSQAVILDMDLGIGMDYVDPVRRFRCRTLRKNIIAKKLREDSLAEELRLFYVAMTRPKDKLILTCVVKDPCETLLSEDRGNQGKLTFLDFVRAQNYLDFLKPILKKSGLKIRPVGQEHLAGEQVEEQIDLGVSRSRLQSAGVLAEPGRREELQSRFSFCYPYENLQGLYTKTTVSELKIAVMSERDEAAYHAFEEEEPAAFVPDFRREQEPVTGTVRGNAYHRAMELLDFEEILGCQFKQFPESYEAYLKGLEEHGTVVRLKLFLESQRECLKLSEEYRKVLREDRIYCFLRAEIGYRMWRAFRNGGLFREQPFVLAVPATRLREDFPAEEKVLVQGIIDVYFIEDGEIVLLDYKTDVISDHQALRNRYETQLEYYGEALERLMGRKVKEKILYSFHLSSESSF